MYWVQFNRKHWCSIYLCFDATWTLIFTGYYVFGCKGTNCGNVSFSRVCYFNMTIALLLLLLNWQSPGLPGWRNVNLITATRRPLHPSIAAGFYCLTTSPGFLPALCEKWSGFFYVHMVWLSYTRDRRLKVSSERIGNEDKAPCPRALLPPGRGSMHARFTG